MIDLDETALRGSIPPLVTPFKDGGVDYEAYAGLVDYQVENGTPGVLVNGTTSEPSSLTSLVFSPVTATSVASSSASASSS